MAFTYTTGSQVGRFILETEIGHGSTGVVYRARDLVFQRPVALKILAQHLTLDENARSRFEREATAVASLRHPHIAQIHEFAVLPDCLYLATEWIEGRTLAALLKDHKPLPLERALKLFDQLASAIDYAHQQGVIHYDIKPANVMVNADDHAYIVDFELAWLSDAPSSTNAGMLFGTPRYMAPEQIRGEAVDGRADIYSLAAMLFEMLTGQPPFIGESTPALLYHHLYTAPPPVTEINPSLPVSVEIALLRALAKRPLNRFETAAEFGLALRSPTPLPYPAGPAPSGMPPPLAPPRQRWLPAALPIWLWWIVAGSIVIWMLTFLAFRAYRLTVMPIPTIMATLTPQSDRVIAAHVGGTFSPQDLGKTPDLDDLPPLPPATPPRGVVLGNALALTAVGPELSLSVPLTSGTLSLTLTAFVTTPTAADAPTLSSGAVARSPTPPTTTTEQSTTLTTAETSAVASQTATTAATSPASSRTPTASVTSSPTGRTSTPSSPAPTLSSPTARPSPTRTHTPSRTPTPIPTATPTLPPTATLTPIPSATAIPTIAAPAAGGWWPMTSGDATNSGFVAASFAALVPTPRWQVPASGGREFGIVAGNGLVLYSTTGTDVRALNWATGEVVWTKTLGTDLVGDLILETLSGGQAIVVAPTSQGLVALNLQNGTTAWRAASEGLLSATLGGVTAGADGTLYALTRSGWLYALDPSGGELEWWRQLTPTDEYALPPTLAGTTLLMTSRNRVVRAFDLNTLKVLWARTLPESLVTPPCVSEAWGLAYVGSEQGTLYTLWLHSGAVAWSAQMASQVAGLAHDDWQVYVTAINGTLFALDGSTGALAWAVSAGAPVYSPPLTDGNQVLVTTLAGQVRFFSTATGQETDSRRISLNDPVYQGAAPAGGWLFVRGSSLYGVSP